MSRPWTSVVNGVQLNLSEQSFAIRYRFTALSHPVHMHPCDSQRNSILATLEFATATGSQPSCRTAPWKNSETSETDLRNFTHWYSFSIGWAVSPLHTLGSFVSDFREKTLQKKDPAMNVWMVCGLGKKNVHVEWSGKNKLCCCFYCSIAVGCWWGLQKIDRVTFGIMTDEQVLDLGGPVWNQPISNSLHTPSAILRMCKKSTSQIRGESSFGRAAPYATH